MCLPSKKSKYPNPLGIAKLGRSPEYFHSETLKRNQAANDQNHKYGVDQMGGYYESISRMQKNLGRPLKQNEFELIRLLHTGKWKNEI